MDAPNVCVSPSAVAQRIQGVVHSEMLVCILLLFESLLISYQVEEVWPFYCNLFLTKELLLTGCFLYFRLFSVKWIRGKSHNSLVSNPDCPI